MAEMIKDVACVNSIYPSISGHTLRRAATQPRGRLTHQPSKLESRRPRVLVRTQAVDLRTACALEEEQK